MKLFDLNCKILVGVLLIVSCVRSESDLDDRVSDELDISTQADYLSTDLANNLGPQADEINSGDYENKAGINETMNSNSSGVVLENQSLLGGVISAEFGDSKAEIKDEVSVDKG